MTQFETDQCIKTMEKYGGDFAKALAFTWRKADPYNKLRIETAFTDFFAKYLDLSKAFAQIP